ncbi:N-acetyltransferase family protein [Pseudactinotalea sp. Z1748]|uniref:GNAT family N-acetyltransferase n=1 Tax=Pseudactinotalea sp. Z1748 TaxID=3413027 RepID=UPI003C7D9C0F
MRQGRQRAAIRSAGPGDAEILAQVHIRTWQQAFADLLAAEVVQAHAANAAEQWARRLADPGHAAYWVAERAGQVVGFSWAEAAGPGQVRPLELIGLYVLEEHYGTGVADDLLVCAVGEAPCFLWVARDNARARSFYARHDFVTDGQVRRAQEFGGLPLVRMVR